MTSRYLYIIPFVLIFAQSCADNSHSTIQTSSVSLSYIASQLEMANEIEFYRGSGFYDELKYRSESRKYNESPVTQNRLTFILAQTDTIENACAHLIKTIEELKIELLKKEGENLKRVKNKNSNTILWRQYESEKGALPSLLNLAALKKPGSVDAVNSLLVGSTNETPSKKGIELWNELIEFRRVIVKHSGTYSFGKNQYEIDVAPINDFENDEELKRKVEAIVDESNANIKEDRQVLIDIYVKLTKVEFVQKNGTKLHWVNSMFTDVPLSSALSNLSALQHEILSARSLAYAHWRSKMGHCCNSFNQIIPIVTGPSTINKGQEFEIIVSIGAFDSEKNPVVSIDGLDSQIDYDSGLGIVTLKPTKQGIHKYKGKVKIKNNSGHLIEKDWEWTVNVLDQ